MKSKRTVYKREWSRAHPERVMYWNAQQRAKKAGVPFTITVDDIEIPAVCPVLGIPLKQNLGKGGDGDSPSLDRLVPELGYVPGNIVVISKRANMIKNCATPEELMRVATWVYDRLYCASPCVADNNRKELYEQVTLPDIPDCTGAPVQPLEEVGPDSGGRRGSRASSVPDVLPNAELRFDGEAEGPDQDA